MIALVAAIVFPSASARALAELETFVTVALFSGLGLLVSISMLGLGQHIPEEWF